jgi:hypothetical protein
MESCQIFAKGGMVRGVDYSLSLILVVKILANHF